MGTVPTLVVLAGGQGTRLGGLPKGLLRLPDGVTVIEHLLELGDGSAFVSTNHPEWYERLDVPLVADLQPDRGAPGGVITALAMATTEWVTIVACDMPFVNREMLETLWQHRHAHTDAICFTRGDQLEPLVGLYRRSLVYDWEPRLDGCPSMRSLAESVRLDTINWHEPERLMSLNSPDDFRTAVESFSLSRGLVTLPLQVAQW
ncbi:MAG: molybdenum cofactor guanylyltransferase [Archangium gephyra]|uniref:Molybdenum cofactor guanylyltransferase n=1 Tax=Archangium gephyra TaxID=48 RepID=A0A2W5US57_9BACT|nr:MAG: molybdenum cofactor guanylyltransferase [Archangium gephyra]